MVKVLQYFPERDAAKHPKSLGRALVELEREGEPIIVTRRFKRDNAKDWESVEVAKAVGGVVRFTVNLGVSDKGNEYAVSDVVLTFDESQQVLAEAAELRDRRASEKPIRHFGR